MFDTTFTNSSYGGGWIVAHNRFAKRQLRDVLGSAPYPLAPLGGAKGWIVKPKDMLHLAEMIDAIDLTVDTY